MSETVNLNELFNDEEEAVDMYGSEHVEEPEASLDDLDVRASDEELDRRQANLFLTKGVHYWVKNEQGMNCEVKLSYSDQPGKTTDISTKGRAIITVNGLVKNTETGKQGRFGFQYSPDVRTADNGEADLLSQNHTKIATYILNKYGKRHESEKWLAMWLQRGKYRMYINVGKSGRPFFNNVQD